MTVSATPADVLADFFAQFGVGDIVTLLSRLDEDIDWQVQGDATVPWTGVRRGKAQVAAFFDVLSDSLTPRAFAVAVEVAGGRIVRHRMFEDSAAAAAAFRPAGD